MTAPSPPHATNPSIATVQAKIQHNEKRLHDLRNTPLIERQISLNKVVSLQQCVEELLRAYNQIFAGFELLVHALEQLRL